MTSGIFDSLSADAAADPVALVQREGKRRLPRRFYAQAAVAPRNGRFIVTLDGKPVHTPRRELLALPTLAAAEAVSGEWAAQAETIDPAKMPMTRIVNSAIDGVVRELASVQAE